MSSERPSSSGFTPETPTHDAPGWFGAAYLPTYGRRRGSEAVQYALQAPVFEGAQASFALVADGNDPQAFGEAVEHLAQIGEDQGSTPVMQVFEQTEAHEQFALTPVGRAIQEARAGARWTTYHPQFLTLAEQTAQAYVKAWEVLETVRRAENDPRLLGRLVTLAAIDTAFLTPTEQKVVARLGGTEVVAPRPTTSYRPPKAGRHPYETPEEVLQWMSGLRHYPHPYPRQPDALDALTVRGNEDAMAAAAEEIGRADKADTAAMPKVMAGAVLQPEDGEPWDPHAQWINSLREPHASEGAMEHVYWDKFVERAEEATAELAIVTNEDAFADEAAKRFIETHSAYAMNPGSFKDSKDDRDYPAEYHAARINATPERPGRLRRIAMRLGVAAASAGIVLGVASQVADMRNNSQPEKLYAASYDGPAYGISHKARTIGRDEILMDAAIQLGVPEEKLADVVYSRAVQQALEREGNLPKNATGELHLTGKALSDFSIRAIYRAAGMQAANAAKFFVKKHR